MQDAFRQALAQTANQPSSLDGATIEAMQEAASRPEPMAAMEVEQLRNQVRQLGRAWSGMLNIGTGDVGPMRASWRTLMGALQSASVVQRRTVLQDFERSLGYEDARQARRMRTYLTRRGVPGPVDRPSLEAISWISWPSPGGYFIVTLEELQDSTPEERQAIHARLSADGQRRFFDTLVECFIS